MVENFPGPYTLRFHYTTTPTGHAAIEHSQVLNVDLTADPTPGDAFNNIQAVTKGGVAVPDLAAAVDAWHTLMADVHHTVTTLGFTELWKHTPLTYQSTFISSYNSAVVIGTEAIGSEPSQQDIMTFRTIEGGILKVNVMEATNTPFQRTPYPNSRPEIDAIQDFVKGDTSWILGRDTSYVNAALNYLVGQNEKLFRLRWRP